MPGPGNGGVREGDVEREWVSRERDSEAVGEGKKGCGGDAGIDVLRLSYE